MRIKRPYIIVVCLYVSSILLTLTGVLIEWNAETSPGMLSLKQAQPVIYIMAAISLFAGLIKMWQVPEQEE